MASTSRTCLLPCPGLEYRLVNTLRLAALAQCCLGGAILFPLASAVSAAEVPASLPPAASQKVDFQRDIKPILEASCLKCHAHGQKKGGFQVDSREMWIKGGESGPSVKAGESAASLAIRLTAGFDPDRIMPQKGPRLTTAQIGLLRAWVDQGLPWPNGLKLNRGVQAPLEPRQPPLPAAKGKVAHPIDRLLQPYYAQTSFVPPAAVEDRVYARRVYLDVIGLLPTPDDLNAFLKDHRRDKRERLVQRLLADNQRYADHMMSFWNDALRNDYRGTGYIDGGRKQITPWLHSALATNMPFDRFVAKLVSPDEHSEGFTKGIVWRGAVNASQNPPVQAAQNVAQVFMGINLKCASCHDSFISDWKLSDAYGLASVYADTPLELVRCDKPTGETARRQFLYPELGTVIDSTNKTARLESLAQAITNPRNGRLTRTIVNRLWARLMGRGLVEPVDEMDNPPWNADLLDWLATDLSGHGYDLKRTIGLILTSQAYQLPSVNLGEQTLEGFVFRGPAVRRLSAEQYLDAIDSLTGVWHTLPANTQIDFDAGRTGPPDPAPAAVWIWASPGADKAVAPQTIYLRKTIRLDSVPSEAAAVVVADNRFTLYVNGAEAGSSDEWERPRVIDLRTRLRAGENVFAVSAVNDAPSKDDSSPNPAGFLFEARLRVASASGARPAARVRDFASDATWLCTTNHVDGWEKPDFKAEGWHSASELGDSGMAPWSSGQKLAVAWSNTAQYGKVRTALVNNDPLMTALGRPSREQVLTTRIPTATTMQALELTNGRTLAGLLKTGAGRLLEEPGTSGPKLASRLFLQGLGREPSHDELKLVSSMVGQPAHREGVEDLLWTLSLLPEFQLIY